MGPTRQKTDPRGGLHLVEEIADLTPEAAALKIATEWDRVVPEATASRERMEASLEGLHAKVDTFHSRLDVAELHGLRADGAARRADDAAVRAEVAAASVVARTQLSDEEVARVAKAVAATTAPIVRRERNNGVARGIGATLAAVLLALATGFAADPGAYMDAIERIFR